VPVLVITSHPLFGEHELWRALDCDGILTKPCRLPELLASVTWLLDDPSAARPLPPVRRLRRNGPRRAGRARAARREETKPLQALVLWADFLTREAQGLQVESAFLRDRAARLNEWSGRLLKTRGRTARTAPEL
jgi:hypothetical protein